MIYQPRHVENKTVIDLFMQRGESETLVVWMEDMDNPNPNGTYPIIPFVTGDTVYFTVKDKSGVTIFAKTRTSFTPEGSAVFDILPSDTLGKKAITYVYDVRVKRANNTVTTILYPANFELEAEVSTIT